MSSDSDWSERSVGRRKVASLWRWTGSQSAHSFHSSTGTQISAETRVLPSFAQALPAQARATRALVVGLQEKKNSFVWFENLHMTARSKLREENKEAASSFYPFAPVESILVAKVSIGERRCCWDIDRVVTWPLLAQGRVRTRVSRVSSRRSYHWAASCYRDSSIKTARTKEGTKEGSCILLLSICAIYSSHI